MKGNYRLIATIKSNLDELKICYSDVVVNDKLIKVSLGELDMSCVVVKKCVTSALEHCNIDGDNLKIYLHV